MTEENTEFANKLQEAMSAAMGTKQPEPQEEVVEEIEEQEPEQQEEGAEGVEEEQEESEKPVADGEFKLIPKEWTKAEQDKFQEALDNPDLKEAAEAFISRYENLRKDYHKKAGERAEFAKKVSVWDEVFDDKAKEALRQKGIDEAQYVKNLLNVEKSLLTNPVETVKWLIDTYQVDPKQLVSDAINDDGIVDYDKTITEMKKELDELKNSKKQSETQSAATEEAYIAKHGQQELIFQHLHLK